MITVNSISGGRTSGYIYANYPADVNIFALVCCDDAKCAHPDKKVMQLANDKLNKYGNVHGEFIGTTEHVKTVKVVLDLEQKYGREIVWVRGKSWEQLIEQKSGYLPNRRSRWCTDLMKIEPIFWWLYLNTTFPVKMRVGYRPDEAERIDTLTTTYSIPITCNNYGQKRQNWEEFVYRVGEFPLVDNLVFHYQIVKYWKDKGIDFPPDSNCQNCPHKQPEQLRKNFDDAPAQMNWAKNIENKTGNRFLFDMNMSEVEKMKLQLEFEFGAGLGCKSGFCHN